MDSLSGPVSDLTAKMDQFHETLAETCRDFPAIDAPSADAEVSELQTGQGNASRFPTKDWMNELLVLLSEIFDDLKSLRSSPLDASEQELMSVLTTRAHQLETELDRIQFTIWLREPSRFEEDLQDFRAFAEELEANQSTDPTLTGEEREQDQATHDNNQPTYLQAFFGWAVGWAALPIW